MPEPIVRLYFIDKADLKAAMAAGKAVTAALEDCTRLVGQISNVRAECESRPPRFSWPSVTLQHPDVKSLRALLNHAGPWCESCCHFQRSPARCNRYKKAVSPKQQSCAKYGAKKPTYKRKMK